MSFLIELHPSMAQFAVALLSAAVVLDALGVALTRDNLVNAGYLNQLGGAVFALLAVATGFLAQSHLPARPPAGMAILALHQVVTISAFLFFAGLAAWRLAMRGRIPLRGRTLYLALSITAAFVLATGAILGGVGVYRHGLGVSPSLLKPELLAP